MMEIKKQGTFSSLTDAVEKEKSAKAHMEEIVIKYAKFRNYWFG